MTGSGRRLSFHFPLAVVILGSSASFLQIAKSQGWLQLIKKALPIRKPLLDFDRASLAPLKFVRSDRLSSDTIEELGTNEYIEWILEDPKADGPLGAQVSASVTYYTGLTDQIPHVPEECFFQGAYSLISDEKLDMELAGRSVPIRKLTFYPPPPNTSNMRTYVYYTIAVNGDFYDSRQPVRIRMIQPTESHLYYSKVEARYGAPSDVDAGRLDEAAGRTLGRLIAELERAHWPPAEWARTGPPQGEER